METKETFAQHQNINKNNYKKLDNLIETEKVNIKTYEEQLAAERKILKESADTLSFAEKVLGVTYVQSLVSDDRCCKVFYLIPNGFWQA